MVTYEIFVGALFSLLVVGAGAFYWLMSEIRGLRQDMRQEIRAVRQENREDNQALRKENREDNQALREEIQASTQRTLEALYFHRHDPDGLRYSIHPHLRHPPSKGRSHDHNAKFGEKG